MSIDFLVRPRLLRRLQAALQSRHVVMTAPAGYGKTVLMRSLAAHQPHAYYLSLSTADADLTYFQTRLERLPPAALSQSESVLLLDDIHHLEDGPETLDWLVAQFQQDRPRLLLAGQRIPRTIGEYVMRGQVAQLEGRDLAFSKAESQALLLEHHVDNPEVAAHWHRRTRGWPLALALLARVQVTPDPLLTAETDLFTYLAHSLFQDLPPALRRFLQVTAVPLQFNDELAAILLGDDSDPAALRSEAQHRNLFLEPADKPGWFHYHDLIRDFLRESAGFGLAPLYQRVVGWYEARGDLEMAIEHALAGGLQEEAVRLIYLVPAEFVWTHCRYLTFRRWIHQLDEKSRAANPALLVRLGNLLMALSGLEREAWDHLHEALRLAEASGNKRVEQQARFTIARILHDEGAHEKALADLRPLLNDPAFQGRHRLYALRLAAIILTELARFGEGRQAHKEAIAEAEALGDEQEVMINRQNLAAGLLISLGEFEEAREHLEAAAAYFQSSPGWQLTVLSTWCDFYGAQGNWRAMASALQRMGNLFEQLEAPEADDLVWYHYYQAMLLTSRSETEAAQSELEKAIAIKALLPLAELCIAWQRSWMLRRQGLYQEAVQLADETLARPLNLPFYRTLLALERDISNYFLFSAVDSPSVIKPMATTQASLALHAETTRLVRWRARSELVRLRALLALCAREQGERRARRHLQAALYALTRPDFQYLLTGRDPELGGRFWALALLEDVAVQRATLALQEIGSLEPVLPLLRHSDAAVRLRAARAIAAIGREEAMPALGEALSIETDATMAAALQTALTHLESLPPPQLEVRLLGDFVLKRGDQPVTDDAWQRPIVRRLFHYFAVHRGQPLPRDRILEDLWPDAMPDKAWATFRTVYSRLRRVVEPYMQPKADSRYFALVGDSYCFDPAGYVTVDLEIFEAAVRDVLMAAEAQDVPPLPKALLTALEQWAPLLPELPYEEWLLEVRERVNTLYVEGCLYMAQSLLVYGRAAEAVLWARQAITTAPWLEEGYQALMRAYARQGQRGLALKTYEEAQRALRRELDITPSVTTQWLANRLHTGEEI